MKLENFSKLRAEFKPITLTKGKGEELFFNGEMVVDENGTMIPEGESFINIGYTSKNHIARGLSNLFPYNIKFMGKKAKSIEGILQGIKHKEPKIQNLVFNYAGIDAYHTRGSTKNDDWRKSQTLYFKNKEINRNGEEYQIFLDKLYFSVLKNPLYAKMLKSTGNKTLLHTIGHTDQKETVLTKNEYESRINTLKLILEGKINEK